MKKLATYFVAGMALIGAPALAADMAVKAPRPLPQPPAPVPTWTGFYGGIQVGGGWSDEAVNYSPNDPLAALILAGFIAPPAISLPGQQPVPTLRISQSGLVGGVEAGYNWQAGPNWLLGLEADFSFSGMDGRASGTSVLVSVPGVFFATQATTAEQDTRWYGTVRGRAGWLATPNLLLFGTGGFAYGRVDGSANYMTTTQIGPVVPPFGLFCVSNVTCMAGSSSAIRTGWTAEVGSNGYLTNTGARRLNINLSIWELKQCGS